MKIKSFYWYLSAAAAFFAAFLLFFLISSQPVQAATPGPFNFTATLGSSASSLTAPPSSPTFRIYNTTPAGGQSITGWQINSPVGSNSPAPCISSTSWLSLSPMSGGTPIPPASDNTNSPQVTITANPTGLAIGQYCADVTVQATSGGVQNSPFPSSIRVTLTVTSGVSPCNLNLFTANGATPNLTVAQNTAVSLAWRSSNCTSGAVTAPAGSPNNANMNYNASASISNGSTPGGTISTANVGTTTYTINASGAGGPAAPRVVTVTVNAGASVCQIISFTALPASVPSGGTSTLSWQTQNCNAGTLNGGIYSNKNENAQIASGTEPTGALFAPTTYTLSVTGPIGTDTRNVTVTISAALACAITSFIATPTSVNSGGSSSLAWTTSNCTSATLSQNTAGPYNPTQSVATSSAGTTTGAITSTTTYTLNASGGAGAAAPATLTVTLNVSGNCTITSFVGNPLTVGTGGSSVLTWTTQNCSSVTLSQNTIGPYNTPQFVAVNNPGGLTVFPPATTIYTLNASGTGAATPATVTITVSNTPCTLANVTFTADSPSGNGLSSASVTQNQLVTLRWTIPPLCRSARLTASGANDNGLNVTASIPSGSRVATTANLGSTNYTLTVTPSSGGPITRIIPVTVNAVTNCTVRVTSYYNGSQGVPPGGAAFTIIWSNANGSGSISNNFSVQNPFAFGNNPASGTSYNAGSPTGVGGGVTFTGITPASSQTCFNGSTIFFNYNFITIPACAINTFTAAPNPISRGTASTLSWTTSGCTSASLNGGAFRNTNASPVAAGNISTGNRVSTTTFTLTALPGSVTRNVTVTVNAPPQPPGNPTAWNTALDATVACGQIKLTWTAGAGATSYNLYRNTVNTLPGVAWQTGIVAVTYTDAAPLAGSSYYWVQSQSAGGTSSAIIAANSPMARTPCQVNLGTSGKVVTAVNSIAYTFNSSCITSQVGTVKIVKNNDVVSFNLNVCNTGTIAANNVIVTDDISGTNLYNVRNIVITGGGSSSTVGNITTFNLGTIGVGLRKTVTFDADVRAPVGGTQTLYRFRNIGNLTYTSSGGNATLGCNGTYATVANPCVLDTGYIVFYNGQKAPVIKEVSP